MRKKLFKRFTFISGTFAICTLSLLILPETTSGETGNSTERTTGKATSRNSKPKSDKYTPRTGERRSLSNGKSKLNENYWKRVKE